MADKSIFVFINAYYFRNGYGLSGGDKRAIEVLRRWTGRKEVCEGKEKIAVIAPGKIFTILSKDGIAGFQSVDTSEKGSEDKNIFSAYRIHTKNAMRYVKGLVGEKNGGGRCIFYTTSDYITDILPASYGKRHIEGAKWYAIIHHIIEDYHTRPGSRLHNWLAYLEQQWCIRRIVRDADRILTVSPLVYDYLRNEQNVPQSRLALVSNGIDVETIDGQQPFPEPEKQYDGVFLARLVKSKGILELPDIWKKVTEAVPGARLCIVGDGTGEMVRQLKDAFEEKGIADQVTVAGFLSGDEVYRQLKSSKVFLLPSHEEGWGIVIAEAMGCGLPVVTYDLPVFPRIFHGMNLSGPIGDTETFAGHVIDLLRDRKKRTGIGKAGKALVDSRYTWDQVAEQDWELLHES